MCYTKFIAKFLCKKGQKKELIEILNLELKQLNVANIEVILMLLYGKKMIYSVFDTKYR